MFLGLDQKCSRYRAYLQNPAIIGKNRNAGSRMSFKDLFIIYSTDVPLLASHLFLGGRKKKKKKQEGECISNV